MLKDEKFTTQQIQHPDLEFMPDRPSEAGISALELKQAFGYAPMVRLTMEKINLIIDALTDSTAGNEIGVTVPGDPSITTLQQALERILQLIAANRGLIDALDASLKNAEAALKQDIKDAAEAAARALEDEVTRLEALLAEKARLPRVQRYDLLPAAWAQAGAVYRQTVAVANMAATDLIAWGHPAEATQGQMQAAAAALMKMDSQGDGYVDFVVVEPPTVAVPALVINYGRGA